MMNNEITIYGHQLIKTKLNDTDYQIAVIRAQKFEFLFLLTSDKKEEGDISPIFYRLKENQSELPRWLQSAFKIVLKWVAEDIIPVEPLD